MKSAANDWTEELSALQGLLNETELTPLIKWGIPVYCHEGQHVVGLAGFKNFVCLWFYQGVFLSDPDRVLLNAQEGKTRALRQWRFTDSSEINPEQIRTYLAEAIAHAKEGKKLAPVPAGEIIVPEILEKAFQSSQELQSAFDQLTPGKQREYIEYLNQAKRDATKQSRLEKITPMILEGKGLNDQYK
ncbi:YdeI/OmpD-associated family protein [Mongoliitalea daihaiensis]|uniref:YdeI/OmpD-associated family protein n=1 Tax=Mongoliitalea daihaiensis TaxID=2782006 RepID=UPI001F24AA68|nr:YdeI/OmpD-associated family protein [Mongoliitalea daihaiensis]UJP64927.1 YdeI/OmpD-associated family protein [Mongoliitalea daihaiensis]